jgi:ankyrin repeat protein
MNTYEQFITACQEGSLVNVQRCIDNGLDIHFKNDKPLMEACYYGHIKIVRYLLESGANPLRCDYTDDNFTPILNACSRGFLEIVKLLIQYGADIENTNYSCLGIACYYGYFDIVKYLLQCGMSIHHTCRLDNCEPFEYAYKANHYELTRYLLKLGANVQTNDNEALRWAIRFYDTEFMKLFLNSGADPRGVPQINYVYNLGDSYLPVSPRKRWLL